MIAVVTQGGLKEGLGHVMRMLCLMDELGFDATFLLNGYDDVVFRIVRDRGFDVLSGDQSKLIEDVKPDVTIFDKFDVEEELAAKARRFGKVIMFDSTTANEFADLTVNALVSCKGKDCYHGLRYLILRKEFSDFWKMNRMIRDEVEKIMLIFGGSDPSNLTAKVLRIMEDFDVTVVVGPRYVYFKELERIAEEKNAEILVNPRNIAKLMFRSDLVITSLGLTMFEAMCVGTPVLAICQNDTQRWIKSHMPFLKFVLSEFDESEFMKNFEILLDGEVRENLSKFGKSLCDGMGLFRVVNLIQNLI